MILGRLGWAPDKPTVTFYGHYDVQPALEPDWRTRPFELVAVNEYLYGRGTSDNKGPILAFIFAVREWMESCKQSAGKGRGRAAGRWWHAAGSAVRQFPPLLPSSRVPSFSVCCHR